MGSWIRRVYWYAYHWVVIYSMKWATEIVYVVAPQSSLHDWCVAHNGSHHLSADTNNWLRYRLLYRIFGPVHRKRWSRKLDARRKEWAEP